MNDPIKFNGASQTMTVLQRLGVTDIFGYPGGAIMPMYDAIYSSPIKHYLCRHEQGAAFAAVGYARASGKVGVCVATSGPGATNLITGLADAMADSVPVVAITGQVPTRAMGTDGFQEVDIISLSLACTKHSFQIRDVNEIPECIEQAFEIAASGRPGPVLIDIPKDVQVAQPDSILELIDNLPKNLDASKEKSDIKNQELLSIEPQIQRAVQLISNANQPVIYVGGGVGLANAVQDFRQLLENSQFPCVATLKGLGAVDGNHPNYLGMLGMHGTEAANLAIQESDLLIVLGARFDDRATGKLAEFAPNAKVIHMDIDPAEVNKRRLADVAIVSDLKNTLPMLNQSLLQQFDKPTMPELQKWQSTCHQRRNKKYDYNEDAKKGIFAPRLLELLSDSISKDHSRAVHVTTDVGQHQMWAAQHMRFSQPEQFITSAGLGTMGFGVPASIGAQISDPSGLNICVTGDGSFMMNIQELGTIKRYQIPIKIVLIDNSRLGLVRQWQQLFFEERYSETDLSDNPDFVALAKAFDIEARMINQKDRLEQSIEEMLAHEGPYLLHVKIDAFENVWPLVPPDTANDEMMISLQGE
ncbi:MAG: acetolactate synthase 2 catalytic subunit [Kangiellaceae bacterium]|nr:acetolactate synthase 2 catalytic subunit [Kangiellaceae bacterium]